MNAESFRTHFGHEIKYFAQARISIKFEEQQISNLIKELQTIEAKVHHHRANIERVGYSLWERFDRVFEQVYPYLPKEKGDV